MIFNEFVYEEEICLRSLPFIIEATKRCLHFEEKEIYDFGVSIVNAVFSLKLGRDLPKESITYFMCKISTEIITFMDDDFFKWMAEECYLKFIMKQDDFLWDFLKEVRVDLFLETTYGRIDRFFEILANERMMGGCIDRFDKRVELLDRYIDRVRANKEGYFFLNEPEANRRQFFAEIGAEAGVKGEKKTKISCSNESSELFKTAVIEMNRRKRASKNIETEQGIELTVMRPKN